MELGNCGGKRALAGLASTFLSLAPISSASASETSLCELMPIAVEQTVLQPLAPGDTVSELSIRQGDGHFGWLTWVGSPSSPVLAASLILPGDSDTYISPDDAADNILNPGDWVQGSPGVTGSNAVKAALNALLNVPIDVPVWDLDRSSGNNFDYHVVTFATIALTEYRLDGQGWLSFTYLGEKNCFNTSPVAGDLAYQVDEEQSVAVTLTATDDDGDSLSYVVQANPVNGQLSGTPPDLSYMPASDFNGTDNFSYLANDGQEDSNTAVVTITVNPVNDAPVAFNQQLEFAEDTSVPVTLQGEDVDGDSLTFTQLTSPVHGVLSGAGAAYTYTPNANFVGDDSFTFNVNDGQVDSNTATVYLTTNPVNDAPVSENGNISTVEDELVEITLVASDIDGDDLSYSLLAAPAHGAVQFVSTNILEYQPAAGFYGADQLTFFTSDGLLDSNVATIAIEVIERNRAPQITTTAMGESVQREQYLYQVEATDPNINDTLAYQLDRGPVGMAIDSATGQIQWATDEQYVSGLRSVNNFCALTTYDEQFRALDLTFLTDITGSASLPATLLDVLVVASESELEGLNIGSETNPNQYGLTTFATSPSAISVNGTELFPAAIFASASSQIATVADGPADGLAALQAVLNQYPLRASVAKHLVLGVNETPATVDTAAMAALTAQLQAEDYKLSVIVDARFQCDNGEIPWGVDANNVGYTMDGGEMGHCDNPVLLEGDNTVLATYVELALLSGGSVWDISRVQASESDFAALFNAYLIDAVVERFSVPQADLAVAEITLDPTNPLLGNAVVWNRGLAAAGQSVNLTIIGLADGVEYLLHESVVGNLGAAEAMNVAFALPADLPLESVSVSLSELPAVLECASDNNSLIAPLVSVQVVDAGGLTDEQHYALNVYEANDEPAIISDPVTSAHIGEAYSYFVRGDDPDKGDVLRFSLLDGPESMWIHPVTGEIHWLPAESDRGNVIVEVQVSDIAGSVAVQSFSLSVDDLNHAPDIITTAPGTAVLGQLYYYDVNAVDADGDTLNYSLLSAPVGAGVDAATGEITWSADQPGTVSFSVQVGDGRGGFDSQQFDVRVSQMAGNEAPFALPGSYQTPQNQIVDITLSGEDPNGDVLDYTIAVPPAHGTLIGEGANRQYLPDSFYAGPDSFEFSVDDGSLGSLPALVSIEVTDQNNAPIITSEPELPFVLEPASGIGEPVTLFDWTSVNMHSGGQGAANWVVSSDGTQVDQKNNSSSYAFVSDFDVTESQISGTLRVTTTYDDDFIGFVFAWQNDYQYYVFDWKENTRTSGLRGMTVKAVNLAPDGSEGEPGLWATYHSTFTTLYHNNIRWYPHTDYSYTLTFHPGEFTITVKQGETVLDSFTIQDDTFADGKFGFYNRSQEKVRYRGFTREILASREYIYQLEAYDPDGDAITYTLLSGPDGMSLDASTGLLTWQTTSENAGSYEVVLEASDPSGASTTQTYDLVVVEEVPVITTDPAETALADQQYIYDVAAFDPNPDDELSFSLTDAPVGMTIDALSGVIAWSPTLAELGAHDVVVRVTDTGGFFSEQAYVLLVAEVPPNTAPEFTSTSPGSGVVGGAYSYTPAATDTDGDTVSFSLIDVPAGMQMFDGETITWWPTADQATEHTVLLEVGDGNGGTAVQAFTVDVTGTASNHAPGITSQPGQSIQTGSEYEYRVQATDTDGDALTYSLVQGPPGMAMDAQGVVTWTPVETGYYTVTVRVDDGFGAYATQSFEIAVSSTLLNEAPQVISQPVGAAYLGARYDYRLQATDADGDPIVYSVVTGPEGLGIDPYTGVLDWVPSDVQLGEHPVALKAYDGRGGSATQSFTLTVLALSNNLPPQISSTPATTTNVGASYSYQLVAHDPEGDPLTYSLNSAPVGMTMDGAGHVTWTPIGGQEGLHGVAVTASDGAGGTATQSYTLAVDDGTGAIGNLPPVISSTPPNQVSAGTLYQYQVSANDPEGGALAYQLIIAPAGAAVSNSGLVSWTPQSADIGSQAIVVEVSDLGGATIQQHYTLSVLGTAGNQTPQIQSLPATTAKVGLTYEHQILASDADGDILSYSLTAAPTGASISNTGLMAWTPATVGTQSMTVRVSDGIAWTELGWTIAVEPASTELGANILLTPEVADAGTAITVQVVPTGAAGAATASITVDGVNVALDTSNSATIIETVIGVHEIAARIEDAYDTTTVRKTFYIRDPDDATAPLVSIDNIVSGQEITAPVDIVATISDDNLSSWSLLLYRMSDPGNPLELAAGATAVSNAVIAQLDPTLLLNGQYSLQLEALDASRNTSVDAHHVRLTGEMKVGNFAFTLTDLDIPVSGIPITVNRTYDSRQRQQNLDFGYGWSLDYQNIKVEESRPISSGWSLNEYYYGPLGAVVDFCVEPLGTPLVTITLPSGKVETFEVHATPECNQFLPLTDVEFNFVPVDGTTSTLEQTDYSTLRFTGGKLIEIAGDQQPDPSHYVLTTKAGFVYVLDQAVGIDTITDPNGNTLTYTDNGIFHSDGKSVLFERDGNGQITAIIDPSGARTEYLRDSNGDLTTATDPLNAASTYTYNSGHGLLEMFDPLGRKLLKNIYDDDGRLIAQEDGDGNRTDFNHDIAGRLSIITDRNGYATQLFFDDEGNVTDSIDPYGEITSFTFDADGNQTSQTDALGNTRYATFNNRRDQLTQTDELGHTVSFSYNQRGQELTIEDARGN
ncbi:MAG: hypothetical protein DRQ56_02265, partial [Gammaproteobacteria bacterium]